MRFFLFIGTSLVFFLHSCYREVELEGPLPGEQQDVFEMTVSPEMQELLYASRDTSYSILEPELSLSLNGQLLPIRKMSIRGKSALDFRRKSYAVSLDRPIVLSSPDGTKVRVMKKFKLISMAMDYTYISNRVSFGILEKAGMMPLFYKYVEFRMNDQTQGIYFLVEDPEAYVEGLDSECLLRRDYNHHLAKVEYNPSKWYIPEEVYRDRFKEIYAPLTSESGETLHESLSERLVLNEYFRKMCVDYLLQNGDYTDEIFFFSTVKDEKIRFRILPWDYDDIFKENPHEVGRSWGTGTLFGTRTYSSREDIYAEIGDHMIFSIEDDLDYTIAKDPFLYTRYEEVLTEVIRDLTVNDIEEVFTQTERELIPFYDNAEIIAQSQYDRYPCNRDEWEQNILDKQSFLTDRLEWMKSEINLP
ncbi:MAG: CotH kinase family protein [Bacteroidales bacterium]